MKKVLMLIAALLPLITHAQLRADIGSPDFSDWSGIAEVNDDEISLKSGEPISYRYPDGEFKYIGFREYYEYASDWSIYAGLSFEVFLEKESTVDLIVSATLTESDANRLSGINTARIPITGKGWKTVYVPWELFDVSEGQRWGSLQAVKEVEITATSPKNPVLKIRNLHLTKGERIALDSPAQGKSAEAGGTVQYEMSIGNTTAEKQSVQLMVSTLGWEAMPVTIEPALLQLAPGEVKTCRIEVSIPARLPQGIREKQVITVIPNGQGSAAQSLEFTTAVAVPFPNIVFTEDRWDVVRENAQTYDWAKEALAKYEKTASNWKVPELATGPSSVNPHLGRNLYHLDNADDLFDCAIAYQVTRKKEYAEKCALFIRRVVNLDNGYPTTFRGNAQNFVKEGVFFQHVARAYDMILDSGILTDEDKELVENTFRLHIETIQLGTDFGAISNWDVAEVTSALYCALAIQDWHLVEELLYAPTGIYQQFIHGVMSDGWWYECAVGYNLWVASEFSEIGIALLPWGINFIDEEMPIGPTQYFALLPERRVPGLFGMDFMKWGPLAKNSVNIKDMWDAMIPFLDYRGVMFAVNDATEMKVTGDRYELAYYLYRDPEYAAVINRGTERSLLYGVPDLPNVTSEKMKESAYADNIGIVQLRSQAEDREQREQIQATLHYGSHGGHHGHFDRTGFLNMMRYGRSFYNPEMIWYGYASYLYKFLVQTSMTKNMVVVDQKMQEPKESFRTFYYTGDMLQAVAVESEARWSHPPYGGMLYDGLETDFAKKVEADNRSIYIPENAPAYAEVTGYTEPVLQRRLMVMMDDYIVLADYLKAEQEHTFDWLFHVKGFQGLEAEKVELVRHDGQMNKDPLGAAQFITDCDWYETEGTARARFEMCFGKGCENEIGRMKASEDGPLKIDIFNAWPRQNEIMIATAPETFNVNKRIWYSVTADGETLEKDSTGAWILGAQDIEVNISGKKELVLTTRTEKPQNNTIFWGDAKLILDDGSEVFISSLPVKYDNILQPAVAGEDYYGGPVKIEGMLMENSTPGMPQDSKSSGSITIDLSGMDAVAFKTTIGGDFPMGDETQRRKTMAVRSTGTDARYLSVIEPYETESVVKSVQANSANELVVELTDGRTQKINISGLDSDPENIRISVTELLNGNVIRTEETQND
ncbi:hypothetical protein P4C99_07405 [Pontiellaceae bacterium B1224]|nr:hypothetical protein [Pontiellaceae bacterium B1224]